MPISCRLFRLSVKNACDACDSEPIGMDVSEETVGWCKVPPYVTLLELNSSLWIHDLRNYVQF